MAKKIYRNPKVLATLVVVAGLAVGGAIYVKMNSQETEIQQTAADTSYPGKGSQAATATTSQDAAKTSSAATTPAQQENQGSIESSSYTLSLVRAGQSSPGQAVEIRALVTGTSEGSCQVTFSGSGTTFSKSSSISFDGRTNSCGSLDVSASSFSKSGSWSFTLKAINGNSTSNTIQDKVEVQK